MSQAAHILYFATEFGYNVAAYDADGRKVEEYSAGNSRLCSQTYVPLNSPTAVPEKQLKVWAEESAREMADTFGLPYSALIYDDDGEQEYRDERAAAVIGC